MVACGVIGCSNRTVRDRGVSFYRFPGLHKYVSKEKRDLVSLRRNMWLVRVGRQDLIDDDKRVNLSRVCSIHFVKGQPAAWDDIHNCDWAPSLYLGHNYFPNDESCIKRKRKRKSRRIRKESSNEELYCFEQDSVKKKESSNTDSSVSHRRKSCRIRKESSDEELYCFEQDSVKEKESSNTDSSVTVIYLKTAKS